MEAIKVNKLKKYYGKTKAVDGVSFEVGKGEIYGFLGPNGAGKTTTIRCMMDFIRPHEGEIKILDLDAQKDATALKEKIGYLAAEERLYDDWTGQDHIDFLKAIRGNSKKAYKLVTQFNLNPNLRIHHLSSGNKRKLSLILALMSDPEILILDEPTLGFDPLLQNIIYQILKEYRGRGRTVFMSSHNLTEVERICNRVAIIKEGKLVATESIQGLKNKKLYLIEVYFGQKFNKKDFDLNGIKIIKSMPNGLIINVKGDINPIIKKLNKYKLDNLEIKHAGLDEIFLEYYE